MKFICLLLSLYVIILSAIPCCEDAGCMANTQQQPGKKTSHEKECHDCSPFFTCCSCTGFIVSKQISISFPIVLEYKGFEYPAYQQPAIQNIPLSIWQPPQLS